MPIYLAHISENKKREQTLIEHSMNVMELCERYGRKLNLPYTAGLAGLLHDVGKYSDRFQQYMVEGGERGSVKHSFVGAKLLDRIILDFLGESFALPLLLFNEVVSNSILAHHSSLKDMRRPDGYSPYINGKTTEEDYVDIDLIYDRFLTDIQSHYNLSSKNDAFLWLCNYIKQAVYEFANNFYKVSLSVKGELTESRADAYKNYVPFITKGIYSMLIDADRLDTSSFMYNQPITFPDYPAYFKTYAVSLENELIKKAKDSLHQPATPQQRLINTLRQQMSDDCKMNGKVPTGVYQLPIPTGGGKTLSSLRFAIDHAYHHKKDRIIYVVPFTSIVEQNASAIRSILGKDDMLFEHHSNIVHERFGNEREEKSYWIRRINQEQTWEGTIIFTTSVQFLNTVYKNSGRYNRRYHNILNAVVIFDEVQALPPHTFTLFNECVNFLYTFGNTTSVLCTATQPTLDTMRNRPLWYDPSLPIRNLTTLSEDDLTHFDRATLHDMTTLEGWDTEGLGRHIREHVYANESGLIILNTKKTVKQLYLHFKEQTPHKKVYYLTTNLCALHRQRILRQIKEDLRQGEPVLCLSTSLIEAGVDISFHVVYRALNGLDSIAQSVGRCNRNGELEGKGRVYVFKHCEDTDGFNEHTRTKKQTTQRLLKYYGGGKVLSKTALSAYFTATLPTSDVSYGEGADSYTFEEMLFPKIDRFTMKGLSHKELAHYAMYDLLGRYFEVIDSPTRSVLVPYHVTEDELIAMDYNVKQRYAINIYFNQFDLLLAHGLIKEYVLSPTESIYILDASAYDEYYGVIEIPKQNTVLN